MYHQSHQGWTRQPGRRKGVPQVGKRVRDNPTPTVKILTNSPKLLRHTTHAEDLRQTLTGTLISVIPHEFLSLDSGLCSCGVLELPGSSDASPHSLHRTPRASYTFFFNSFKAGGMKHGVDIVLSSYGETGMFLQEQRLFHIGFLCL